MVPAQGHHPELKGPKVKGQTGDRWTGQGCAPLGKPEACLGTQQKGKEVVSLSPTLAPQRPQWEK